MIVFEERYPRLQPIAYLASAYEQPADLEELYVAEHRYKTVNENLGILPTIGSEVEVKLSALQPELLREYFGEQDELGFYAIKYYNLDDAAKAELDERTSIYKTDVLPKYQAAEEAGIPRGKDAFWEFANKPAYHWRTLSTELELLFRSGLIPEGYEHSLHITVAAEAGRGGMALVLSGLELCYLDPNRIVSATKFHRFDKRSGWPRRGKDGLRLRSAKDLDLGAIAATEMRTFSISNSEAAANILCGAQYITACLLAYRQRSVSADGNVVKLADMWCDYRQTLRELWRSRDLPAESWGHPAENPGPWLRWAECLETRDADGSLEQTSTNRIQELILESGGLVDELASQ